MTLKFTFERKKKYYIIYHNKHIVGNINLQPQNNINIQININN